MPTLQTVDTDSRSEGIDAGRMEAFSDGVIAIIVTIMVLELRPPEDVGPAALVPLWPTFLAYALSFSLVAIYWVNHHNLLHAARRVGNDTLWLNVHFLFWLSLFPFAAAYIGDTRGAPFSVALYAGLSTIVAAAYALLNRNLIRRNPAASTKADIARRRLKNLAAIILTASAIPLAFINETIAVILLAAPAAAYILPFGSDRSMQAGRLQSRSSGSTN